MSDNALFSFKIHCFRACRTKFVFTWIFPREKHVRGVVIINFNIDRNFDHKNDLWLIWSLSKEKKFTNNNGFVCFGNANFANSRMSCTGKSVIKEKLIVIDDIEFA